MILSSSPSHQAQYDAQGNIILPGDTFETEIAPPSKSVSERTENIQRGSPLDSLRLDIAHSTRDLIREGAEQYRSGYVALLKTGEDGVRTGNWLLRGVWKFLAQPVWIIRSNAKPKQYSRGSLFMFDTFRFGGTFALLFLALFVTLNYQSFWQIVATEIDPLGRIEQEQTLTDSIDATLRLNLLRSPSLATAGEDARDGALLNFLPQIGPPENRIIIPKLGLNVPLITPSYESLLKEDWVKVEEDIQEALQFGVVHYPGTAKPGQAGNFFVTGHSSYYPWAPGNFKSVFARLTMLEPNDEYWVYYGGDKHRYVIREKMEVKPTNVDVLDQPMGKRFSTLMTCTPVGTTLRRLILVAEEVDPVNGTPMNVGEQPARAPVRYQVESLPI